ncbi:MAG: excinuclease ABC subunit UvrA [Anaerolineae bacterium]|nr:excinuclease ABC subunit UvrA [Anaerolineae bacterium]
MSQDQIIVRGAREHNLKNITVEIPRDKLVVITGLSGSGKSSLAFDTIYAEGQRRYVESLSAYARQFLGQMEKPDVDQIEGLSPAIAIDQKSVSHNPRSTVGTVTEIYDYIRLLYARIGIPHCPQCGRPIQSQSAQQIVDTILQMSDGSRIMILAPLIKDRKGHHQAVFEDIRKSGFVRARVDGQIHDLDQEIELDRYKMHTIEAIVDRLIIRRGDEEQAEQFTRLTDSVETALRLGDGMLIVMDVTADVSQDTIYSEHFSCPDCGLSFAEIEPRTFSFNSPHGACPDCQGLGSRLEIDPDEVIPNPDLSLAEGALKPWKFDTNDKGYYAQLLRAVSGAWDIPWRAPIRNLKPEQIDILLYGGGDKQLMIDYLSFEGHRRRYTTTFEGVIPNLQRRYRETTSEYQQSKIREYMTNRSCPTCQGKRLSPLSLAVTVAGMGVDQITAMPVIDLLGWVAYLANDAVAMPKMRNGFHPRFPGEVRALNERERTIARQVLKELGDRLMFLVDVGLDYLTLDRSAETLSGGEAQRIRLATQIGSRLMGVLYVLDEPSIGLHQRDNARLIKTLLGMRDLGNTLLVVEHDEETIRTADWIIDLGPGAGEHGGQVVAEDTPEGIARHPDSITGAYLSGRKRIKIPQKRRPGNGKSLQVQGASENNLKDIDVRIPLGKFVCITGVSGSGKSTLLIEVLYKRMAQIINKSREKPGAHRAIEGAEHIDKVIHIDQSPIGRTPRSNPATYTQLFGPLRELFAKLPDAKARGYKPGRFSFNVKGGRCEACQGQGQLRIEMQFLPDVYVPCDVCRGRRYNRETLQVRYKEKNIAETLDLTVDEASEFLAVHSHIVSKLKTLQAVGLGYIRLGQAATTLSGGEAQRIKLSRELSKRDTGQTLYVLDEPSVGLHTADVARLLQVLNKLVDKGNTVIIIEHNPDIVKSADWIIDLGPEGGDAGGYVIAEGTPEQIANIEASYTGQFLSRVLEQPALASTTD